VLFVLVVGVLRVVGKENDQGSSTTASTTTTTRTPPPGPHSQIADITLPPEASPDPVWHPVRGEEVWQVRSLSYDGTVRAMNSRLPVNATLDGMPWCGSTQPNYETMTWAWGTADDMVHVTVFQAGSDSPVNIMIGHYPAPDGGKP
jgi:hypothetical protein